jgi:hypothetical protein
MVDLRARCQALAVVEFIGGARRPARGEHRCSPHVGPPSHYEEARASHAELPYPSWSSHGGEGRNTSYGRVPLPSTAKGGAVERGRLTAAQPPRPGKLLAVGL